MEVYSYTWYHLGAMPTYNTDDMKTYKTYSLSIEQKENLLGSATLVFDTSALCSLYNLTEYHRKTMIDILNHLRDRIWLPRQVLTEYEKNREKAISNPIYEKYQNPLFLKNHFIKDVNEQIKQWQHNEYWHPYVEQHFLSSLIKEVEAATKHIRCIKERVKEQYEKRKLEINRLIENDPLREFVISLKTEEELNISYLFSIAKEGYFRYANRIPPGYLDIDKPDEDDAFRKYGDLIIWKSIIKYAQQNQTDVVFVSDDLKSDWVTEKEKFPRQELLSEFREKTGHLIDIYPLPQFIEALKTYYLKEDKPLFDDLDSVLCALKHLEEEIMDSTSGCIVCKCDECGKVFKIHRYQLCLEWDSGGDYDRGMGTEREWYCEEEIECPDCGEPIIMEFSISEYPRGFMNPIDIECIGARVIRKINIDAFSLESSDYFGECECCGGESDDIDR